MNAHTLIDDLIQLTQENKKEVQALKVLSDEKLNDRLEDKSWSILECIEHLNFYGNYYIPEIKNRMEHAKYSKTTTFTSGWLGNYFAKSMMPKEKLNKMKTLKSTNPTGSSLSRSVLEVFIDQQNQLLALLNQAKEVDLTQTKTSISISKWIKLRLGDTFRIVIYHNLRHVVQAKKIIR